MKTISEKPWVCNTAIQGTASINFLILSAKSKSFFSLIRSRFAARLDEISKELGSQGLGKENPTFRCGHCVSKQNEAATGRKG